MTPPRLKTALLPILGLLLLLHILSALGLPVGAFNDDSLHIELAKAVAHGSWKHADNTGAPLCHILPGFSWLLAAPCLALEPHWGWLRLVGLLSAWAVLGLTWLLGRAILPAAWAAAAALLVGLNPVFVGHAGAVMPDIPYTALTLALLAGVDRVKGNGSCLLLGLGAAAASMLRPHGAILCACLAAGLSLRREWRRAPLFLVAAFLPLALWTLRSFFLLRSPTDYLSVLSLAPIMSFGAQAAHVARLLAMLFGKCLLAIPGHSVPLLLAAAAAALLVMAAGANRAINSQAGIWPWCLAAYCGFYMCLHFCWGGINARYLLPLLPAAWLFLLAGAGDLLRRWPDLSSRLKRLCRGSEQPSPAGPGEAVQPGGSAGAAVAAALLCAVAALYLWSDKSIAKPGLNGPAAFQPRTMTWLKEHTLPGARLQSLHNHTVSLLTGRIAAVPPLPLGNRDEWLAENLKAGVSYIHLSENFSGAGIFPKGAPFFTGLVTGWTGSSPYLRKAFTDQAEKTSVVQLLHPEPARFLKAWEIYGQAMTGAETGRPAGWVKARLRETVRLEPTLAHAWAMLAVYEPDTGRKTAALRRALSEDPQSAAPRGQAGPASGKKKTEVLVIRKKQAKLKK